MTMVTKDYFDDLFNVNELQFNVNIILREHKIIFSCVSQWEEVMDYPTLDKYRKGVKIVKDTARLNNIMLESEYSESILDKANYRNHYIVFKYGI